MQFRRTRRGDLDACVDIIDDRFLYADREVGELAHMWSDLLAEGHAYSAVVSDDDSTFPVAFGIAAFVDDELADAYQRYSQLLLGRTLFEQWRQGRSPLLNAHAIARANAANGVNCVVLASGWRPRDEQQRFFASMKLIEGFMDVHLGLTFRSFTHELFCEPPFPPEAVALTITEGQDVPSATGARRTRLMTAHRDLIEHDNFIAAQMFTRHPRPAISFDARSREVLKFAVDGLSDQGIAAALLLSADGLKKRWRHIFQRVRDRRPQLFATDSAGSKDGTRGPELRNAVLTYVRANRTELHPFDDSTATSVR